MIELKMVKAEALRQQKGMLIREIAEKMGTSRAYLNTRLKGHGGMRRQGLVKLASALDYDGEPGELLDMVTMREVVDCEHPGSAS